MELAELAMLDLQHQKRAAELEIVTKQKVETVCRKEHHARLNREIRKLKRDVIRYAVLYGQLTNLFARAERVQAQKQIEQVIARADTPANMTELILYLDTNREKLGCDSALMALAADKIRRDWSEYHHYEDGSVDAILLNADTIERRDER